jgi:alkylhydroperoxidase family enzyme
VDERLRATLGFLEKLTLHHEDLTPADARAVLDSGVSREALEDAIHVAALFNMIDRMADSLAFEPPDDEYLDLVAPRMLAGGYALG